VDDILKKLENLVDGLLEEREKLVKNIEKFNSEIEALRNENVELKEMLREQSVRVEILMKKLENIVGSDKKESV
jgi:predicted nuclease with TOPRIM domain